MKTHREQIKLIHVGHVHLQGNKKGSRFRELDGEREILIVAKECAIGGIYESDLEIKDGEFSSVRGMKFVCMSDDERVKEWQADSWAISKEIQHVKEDKAIAKKSNSIDQMTLKEAKEKCRDDWRFKRSFKRYVADSF